MSSCNSFQPYLNVRKYCNYTILFLILNVFFMTQIANPTWSEYRELGVGWWLRNNANLRKCVEKLAKAAYQSQGDPLDAAIYYLAMKKKNLVWGLFRQVQNERMTQFFSNNFTEERWRKAALKNAYALLGKQRFDHAVAFFLLAGSLKDAVDICLSRMTFNLQLLLPVCTKVIWNPFPLDSRNFFRKKSWIIMRVTTQVFWRQVQILSSAPCLSGSWPSIQTV